MFKQTRKYLLLLLVASALILAACGATGTATPDPNATAAPTGASVSFSKDVEPLLQTSCNNCHGGQRISKGLDMTTYTALMAGSQNGPVLTAGDAANSMLVQLVASGKMPKRGAKFTPAQVQILSDWINAGAKNN